MENSRLKLSLSPILYIGYIFGFSSVNKKSQNKHLTNLHQVYNILNLVVFSLVPLMVLQNLAPKIYESELIDNTIKYARIGVNTCTLSFLLISLMFVVSHLINAQKILKFYSNAINIDEMLEKCNESVPYRSRRWMYLLIVIGSVLVQVFLDVLTTYLTQAQAGEENLNVPMILTYVIESCNYVIQMLFFSGHVSEVTVRYRKLNSSFYR